MTEKLLKIILTRRGIKELPCYFCKNPINVGDTVISHGQRPTKRGRYTKQYHESCFETRSSDPTYVRRWCPVCRKETIHDSSKWETATQCTRCEVFIPWET